MGEKSTLAAMVGSKWVERRVRDRLAHRGVHGEDDSPLQWLGKQEGLSFMSSYNQQGLKPGVLKVSGLGWGEPRGHCTALGEKTGQTACGHTVWK